MPLATGVVTRAQTPSMLEPGIKRLIFDAYRLKMDDYEDLYLMDGSEKAQEHEVMGSGMGTLAVVPEGQPVTFDTMQEAYKKSFLHICFGKGIKVTRQARADNLYGFVAKAAKELGRTAKYTKMVNAMSTFNDMATTTIYTLNGVDRPLVSLTHQTVAGGTYKNRFTNPAALGVETIESALIIFEREMLDHRGRPQETDPKYLCVGTSNRFIARRLLETQQRPFGNSNDVNVLKEYDLQLKVMRHFNDNGSWWIQGAPEETGLRYFNREMWTIETDKEPTTRNDLYMGFYRESHGATHPWSFFGNPM